MEKTMPKLPPDISAPLEYRIDVQAFYHPDEISRVVRPQYQAAARFLIRTAVPKPEDVNVDGNISGRFLQDVETEYSNRLIIMKRFYESFRSAVCLDDSELSWNKFKKIMEEEGVIDLYLKEVNGKKQGKINCYLLKQGKTVHDLAAAAWVAYQVYDQRETQQRSVEPLGKFVDSKDIPGYMSELLDRKNGTLLLFQIRRYRDKVYRALIEAALSLWPHAFTQIGAEGMRNLETAVLEQYVAREIDAITRRSDRKVNTASVEIVELIREQLEARYHTTIDALAVDGAEAPSREEQKPRDLRRERQARAVETEEDGDGDPDDEEVGSGEMGRAYEEDEDDDEEEEDDEDNDENDSVGTMSAADIMAELKKQEEEEERRKRIQDRAAQEALKRGSGRRR